MEEPVCTIQPTMVILHALRQFFLQLNLVQWQLLGWSFFCFSISIHVGVFLFSLWCLLIQKRIQLIAGGLLGLWMLEMLGVLPHCTWRLVKDGLNVCIFYCAMELLLVPQLADMGNNLSRFWCWIWCIHSFVLWIISIDTLQFAAVLGALLFI